MTVAGCPVAGLLLGLLQILPERRRDQWAYLVHRPASRTSILHGKIVAHQVGRRFAFTSTQRRLWTTLVFLLGPAGLLLLWSLREFPAREPCHACGKARVVNRRDCEHCGAPFPAPALDGTEVFEQEAAERVA